MSNSKKCPVCGGSCNTYDSRPSVVEDVLVYRRICCVSCKRRFVTHEIIVADSKGINDPNLHRAISFKEGVRDLFYKCFSDELDGIPGVRENDIR